MQCIQYEKEALFITFSMYSLSDSELHTSLLQQTHFVFWTPTGEWARHLYFPVAPRSTIRKDSSVTYFIVSKFPYRLMAKR